MTLLDHVAVQVDDLDAIGDWYDQLVGSAGGVRTFDMQSLMWLRDSPEPRLWPEYAPDYYAVFMRDPAGNNLGLKCPASTA